jgi:energy-coupling factor transport system permease protein
MEVIFQYRKGNSFIHHMDAVTKTVVLLAISFLAFGSFIGAVQFAFLLFTLICAFVFARLSFSDVWRATKWLILACVAFFLIQTWMLKIQGDIELLRIGNKIIYYEVVDYAAAVSLRIFTIFLASFIFIRTTHPRDLVVSFVQILNIPYKIPYAFFIALRIIPLIEKEARCIKEAHSVRGVGNKAGIRGKLENIKRFTVPLLIRSLRDASVTTHSMESRGFGAHPYRVYVDEISMTSTCRLICIICAVAVVAWYTLILTGIIPFQYSLA